MGNKATKNAHARETARAEIARVADRLDTTLAAVQRAQPSSSAYPPPPPAYSRGAVVVREEHPPASSRQEAIFARIRECLAREGRPLIRDELFALALTLKPTIPVETLQGMRVEDLNRQLRALIVEIGLDNLARAEGTQPQQAARPAAVPAISAGPSQQLTTGR